jgi:alpha-glucosidase
MAAYYGGGSDELDLAWNVPFLQSAFTAASVGEVVEQTLAAIPGEAWPVWAASTHDFEGRVTDRWCGGDQACTRCALLLLLMLRGTPILYYGDEIGMAAPPQERLSGIRRDRLADGRSRDASRTPMQWSASPQGGFTTGDSPWLPVGDAAMTNVDSQRSDGGSILRLVRDLLALRRREASLTSGGMQFREAPHGVLLWVRGDSLIAVNLADQPRRVEVGGRYTTAVCTTRARDGERVEGWLELQRMEGAVLIARGDPKD